MQDEPKREGKVTLNLIMDKLKTRDRPKILQGRMKTDI